MTELLERLKAMSEIERDEYTIKFTRFSSGYVAYAVDEHDMEIAESATQPTVDAALVDLDEWLQEIGE